ncbi:MAG: hypothetical protein ACD_40C00051G0010 [uncultured bacterium]|nr:MAG: hypothetical protein ACD_40C00051G0010 [uncultured bacterium]KKU26472.1 MAG: Mannose-1-phosphate guanylyltransferase (GDP) [Microgenomates group bacterium GW2011_GWA2_46_16]
MSNTQEVKVLIMCGGKGTRMWPISNMAHPKQFESILGKKSMFRETVDRAITGFGADNIYIATSAHYSQHILKQAPEIPSQNFIFEPAMRDNLGALGLASAIIAKRHPGSVMIVLWGADHVVKNPKVFVSALKEAAKLADENDVIVHVDTQPSYPTVHNGWIEVDEKIRTVNGFDLYEFKRFVEKPDLKRAESFYASDKYLIHVGYMAVRPELFLKYYAEYAPSTYAVLSRIMAVIDTPKYAQVLATEYPKFEKISVDYGLFEKLPPEKQWELPADFGWIDVGTWELLYHGLDKDDNGNVVIGQANLVDTKNSLIIARKMGIMGVIGLDGMIVVETDEGMLVCPLSQAPKVKDLYHQIAKL